jgi:hypothetical protein
MPATKAVKEGTAEIDAQFLRARPPAGTVTAINAPRDDSMLRSGAPSSH